jgi:glycosyltransferase involved in cell wall biosynthesis
VAAKPTPFSQIPGKLSECHIGIVPTRRDEFTSLLLPVKLMEYVHMGLPVISSRLPVIERYFDHDEIRFFEPGSAESMAEAIADVLSDPDAARARARRASQRLETFSWPHQRATYLSVVDNLTRTSDRVAAPV